MKDSSSNHQMENSLELLKSIKKVNPSEDLFQKIEQKIESVKSNVVPLFWVKTAAAVFICLFSVEVYILSNQNESSELSEIIQTSDNTLYND